MPVQSLTSSYAVPGVRGKLTGQGSAGNFHTNNATSVAGSRFVPRSENIPAVRVIEGELLEKKVTVSASRQGDFLTKFLQSSKFNDQVEDSRFQSSAAIAVYLRNGGLDDERTASVFDHYV